MQHMMNAVTEKGTQDDVWYVDSGASNHMTIHDEWFGEMQDLENLGYVQTSDDSCHPITHIGKVPLALKRIFDFMVLQPRKCKHTLVSFMTESKKLIFLSLASNLHLQIDFLPSP